jgi:two-component system cell cycle response regulator
MQSSYALPVVLIVSDDPSKINFLKRTLKSFCIVGAENPAACLEWLHSMAIDVLIIDGKMGDSAALTFSKEVRAFKDLANIPILLISNNLKKAFTFQALNAGISDFINEPLDEKEIYQRILVAMKSKVVDQKIAFMASKIKDKTSTSLETEQFKMRFLINDKALKEVSKARKAAGALSLLLIELDSFKEFHRKWGDALAEEALTALTHLLNRLLRKFDVLYPQGGGRFLLLLPKTSKSAATAIAETLREEVSSAALIPKKPDLFFTASIGVVSFDKASFDKAGTESQNVYEQFDRLYDQGQKALDKAKKKGNSIALH